MLDEIKDKKLTYNFLKKEFKNYSIGDDPFEKIITYTKPEIIGIISYSIIYERAEINYIVVSNEKHRQGIGAKLLEYALDDIKKNGCKTVSLEVSEENDPAINLYLKFGFKKQSVRKQYYQGKDAYLMIKELR